MSITAFLSYRYSDSGEALAARIALVLKTLDVHTSEARHVDPTCSLNDQIKSLIDTSNFLICIITEPDHNHYLSTEAGYACGRGKPVIFVAQDSGNIPGSGALFSDQYHISLSKGEFEAASDLIAAVNSIKKKRGMSSGPPIVEPSPILQIEEENWPPEVEGKLLRIRTLATCLEYKKALEEAQNLYQNYPNCWRAGIAISACSILLNEFDQAQEVLVDLVERFHDNRRALSHTYQNMGWLIGERCEALLDHDPKKIEQKIDFYRKSIRCEPRVSVYINLITNLLRLNRVAEAEAELFKCMINFPNTQQAFLQQLDLQGEEFIQAVSKSPQIAELINHERRSAK